MATVTERKKYRNSNEPACRSGQPVDCITAVGTERGQQQKYGAAMS